MFVIVNFQREDMHSRTQDAEWLRILNHASLIKPKLEADGQAFEYLNPSSDVLLFNLRLTYTHIT